MNKQSGARPRRLSTGIAGLDRVLSGGLFRGGIYLVRGRPGAGKTIFGNQVCFAAALAGGRATYVTLLAEAHARMMLHLESLRFFDASLIGDRVRYFSAYNALDVDGLRGVLDLLRRELRAQKSDVLVVDGLVALRDSAASAVELKKFIHELQLHAELVGCTVLLLTGPAESGVHPENTMVDGIFELAEERHGLRDWRLFHVHKFRGDAQLRGGHFFRIGDDGIAIYPRVESVYAAPGDDDDDDEDVRVSSGVEGLDDMLKGGLPRGSTTMVVGPSGAGKTTLGLHFLAADDDGPAVYFGFYEKPKRLLAKAASLSLPLAKMVQKKQLEIVWQPSTEQSVDELIHRLLGVLERTGARRLFIDGLDGLQRATIHPDRVHHVFTALANELRSRGVTTLYSYESPQFLGPELKTPLHGISTLVENLLLLRFVELRSHLYRLLSIMKVRDSDYDSSLREFCIGSAGIRLERTFTSAEAILSGTATTRVSDEGTPARPAPKQKKTQAQTKTKTKSTKKTTKKRAPSRQQR